MTDISIEDEVGPIDYVVIEFPTDEIPGDIAAALQDLLEAGTVHLLDLVFIKKAADGTVTVVELSEIDSLEVGGLSTVAHSLDALVGQEDIEAAAAMLAPGTSGGMLVWENAWAAPFANAVHRAGGEVAASGRIPLATVLEALDEIDEGGNTTGGES